MCYSFWSDFCWLIKRAQIKKYIYLLWASGVISLSPIHPIPNIYPVSLTCSLSSPHSPSSILGSLRLCSSFRFRVLLLMSLALLVLWHGWTLGIPHHTVDSNHHHCLDPTHKTSSNVRLKYKSGLCAGLLLTLHLKDVLNDSWWR